MFYDPESGGLIPGKLTPMCQRCGTAYFLHLEAGTESIGCTESEFGGIDHDMLYSFAIPRVGCVADK